MVCFYYMDGLVLGMVLPFLGTALGAACVFLMKHRIVPQLQKTLTGFAAGVMVAAAVWSLLIPSIDMTGKEGFAGVVPAIAGFSCGIFFLLLLDDIIPHQHLDSNQSEGPKSGLSKTTKLVFAITLHNLPEGMAVGVAIAGALDGSTQMSMAGAVALAVGMAIQNIPEGAIVSMPLHNAGNSRMKSFCLGALSGLVEPVGAAITIVLASVVVPLLPYLLAFAAGAMMYVVVEELIPETQEGRHSNLGTIGFAVGFLLMMVLDVVLG